jgi:hypothetical protein
MRRSGDKLRLETEQSMVFGHNTNVTLGTIIYHVQTEDRGISHALIDTTVYYRGRVLHRRTNSYFDLLPLDGDREQALKLRLDEQHRTVLEEMRAGVIQLTIPQGEGSPIETPAVPAEPAVVAEAQRKLRVELANARSWLTGKHASLQVLVHEENGALATGARVEVEIEGCMEPQVYVAEVAGSGQARIDFEMPRISAEGAALAIRAVKQDAEGHLRFALRAKPKVPSH